MEYIISEEELRKLVGTSVLIKDFLKSKQPVKTLNRWEVEKIFDSATDTIEILEGHYTQELLLRDFEIKNLITAICNLVLVEVSK